MVIVIRLVSNINRRTSAHNWIKHKTFEHKLHIHEKINPEGEFYHGYTDIKSFDQEREMYWQIIIDVPKESADSFEDILKMVDNVAFDEYGRNKHAIEMYHFSPRNFREVPKGYYGFHFNRIPDAHRNSIIKLRSTIGSYSTSDYATKIIMEMDEKNIKAKTYLSTQPDFVSTWNNLYYKGLDPDILEKSVFLYG